MNEEIKELCTQCYEQGAYNALTATKRVIMKVFKDHKHALDYHMVMAVLDNFAGNHLIKLTGINNENTNTSKH